MKSFPFSSYLLELQMRSAYRLRLHRKASSLAYIALPGFWILSRMGEEIDWQGYALPRLPSGCISLHACLVSRSEETSRLSERRIENVQT
jgi:hypothetical protein